MTCCDGLIFVWMGAVYRPQKRAIASRMWFVAVPRCGSGGLGRLLAHFGTEAQGGRLSGGPRAGGKVSPRWTTPSARTAPWLLAAIGTKLCDIGLDISGYSKPIQAESFVCFALNADPDRAGDAGATEAAVASRVLG